MQGPKYSKEARKGELGVQRVSSIIFEDYGWIFKRNPQEFDFGIDGQVEVVNDEGVVTGQAFAVQIKYGKSFLKEENRWSYIYRGEIKHINYLLNYPLPVFILLCDPDSNDVYWEIFNASKTDRTSSAWKMYIPKNQILYCNKDDILNLLPNITDHNEELERYWLVNDVVSNHTDHLHLIIDRGWVESGDISEVIDYFERIQVTRELAFSKQGKVELSFFGYDSDPRELFEIPEVVSFSKKIASRLPLFFFCNPSSYFQGLKIIALCYADAQLIKSIEPQVRVNSHALGDFLITQHQLLNQMIHWLEMTEEENLAICLPIHQMLGVG